MVRPGDRKIVANLARQLSNPILRRFIATNAMHDRKVVLQNSATGTRTRVARVRVEYPNQLDYSGFSEGAETFAFLT